MMSLKHDTKVVEIKMWYNCHLNIPKNYGITTVINIIIISLLSLLLSFSGDSDDQIYNGNHHNSNGSSDDESLDENYINENNNIQMINLIGGILIRLL